MDFHSDKYGTRTGRIIVRDGKGEKDRAAILPKTIRKDLQFHLKGVRKLFEQDLAEGRADVYMPHALAKKYPSAGKSWIWQWVFPAKNCSRDPMTKEVRRHHAHETGLQKAVVNAAKKSGINKGVSPYTLRHSFAVHNAGCR